MAEIASAYVSLLPSTQGFGRKMESQVGGEVRGSGKRLGASFGKMFALAGGALAAIGVGKFLKGSIDEAREAQKVGALTANVIKTTGGAANITAKQVGALAASISLKAGVDDEAIQSGANLLLTFKNVRNEVGKGNDVFNRATQAAVDLSASGFGDLTGTSKQLGKALNDPIKGISALGRSGVTFTEGQKATIKSLVASGDTLKAQKIILGEVESQVGGAAAATATYGEKAGVAFGNIKEQVGTALLPVVDGFFKLFLKQVPAITRGIASLGPAFARVQAFLAPFIAQATAFFGGSGGAGLLSGVKQVATALLVNLIPVVQAVATTFQTTIIPAVTKLVTYVGSALIPVFKQVGSILIGQVLPILSSLAVFFYSSLYPAIIKIYTAVAKNLRPVFDQLVTSLQTKVLPAVSRALVKFREYQPTIQRVILVVAKVIGKLLILASAVLGRVLPVLIRMQVAITGKVITAIVAMIRSTVKGATAVITFGRAFVNAIQPIIKFQKAVLDKVGAVVAFMTKVPGKITKAFGNPLDLLSLIGSQIIQGLKAGISNAWHQVTELVDKLISQIPKIIRKKMGIASPSKVTKILGQYIADGLAKGVQAHGPKVVDAVNNLLDKMRDAMQKKRDGIKSTLDGLKSDFSSLRDSIASTFTSGIFDAAAVAPGAGVVAQTVGQNFISGLTSTVGNLGALKKAFKTLKKWGLSPKFLSQLFASGNTALILELAGDKGLATEGAGLFADANSLSNQLGTSVAGNQYGDKIDGTNRRLDRINKRLADLPKNIGKEINKSAKAGHRGSGK